VEKSDKTSLVNNYLETHPYKLVHKTMYFIQNVIKRGNDVRINSDENLQKMPIQFGAKSFCQLANSSTTYFTDRLKEI